MGTPRSHSTAARPIDRSSVKTSCNNAGCRGGFPVERYIRVIQLFTWRSASSLAMP